MSNENSIQKYLLLPLSKLIIKTIFKFQIFKLLVTLLFLTGFIFCFTILDYNRCGLVPRNLINSGLVFYLLDVAQHLITFNFGEQIVHKIFSKHEPHKLEIWYTLKITFMIVEIIFFVLAASSLSQFTVCVHTKVFMTGYLATYATMHGFIIIILACFGEFIYGAIQKLEHLANMILPKVAEGGIDYLESVIESKLEPLSSLWNGSLRITEGNKERIWKEDLERNYEMLEFRKDSILDTRNTSRMLTSATFYQKV